MLSILFIIPTVNLARLPQLLTLRLVLSQMTTTIKTTNRVKLLSLTVTLLCYRLKSHFLARFVPLVTLQGSQLSSTRYSHGFHWVMLLTATVGIGLSSVLNNVIHSKTFICGTIHLSRWIRLKNYFPLLLLQVSRLLSWGIRRTQFW